MSCVSCNEKESHLLPSLVHSSKEDEYCFHCHEKRAIPRGIALDIFKIAGYNWKNVKLYEKNTLTVLLPDGNYVLVKDYVRFMRQRQVERIRQQKKEENRLLRLRARENQEGYIEEYYNAEEAVRSIIQKMTKIRQYMDWRFNNPIQQIKYRWWWIPQQA